MPEPRDLTASAVDIPEQELHEAVVLDDATEPGQEVRCIVPSFAEHLATDPMPWTPYVTPAGIFYPKQGDRALLSYQVDGTPVIVWWEPSNGSMPDGVAAAGTIVLDEMPLAMFPSGHGWTDNAIGTFSDAGGAFIVNTDRSFHIQTNGNEEAAVATSPELEPVDLTGRHVSFQSQLGFSARLKTVKLRLASGDIATDYAEATIWDDGNDAIALQSTFETQTIPTGRFTITGTVDWTAIKRAQILVTDNKAGKCDLYVAGIYAVRSPKQAIISFCFDDGYASVVSRAVRVLSKYRYPASAYVITDIIGSSETYLTLENLYFLRDQHRWEIGGHAWKVENHNLANGLDSLTDEQKKTELDGLRAWMDEKGFHRRSFAYPKGNASVALRKLVERDYGAGRATVLGPETVPARDPYTLRGYSIQGNSETAAPVIAAIDKAVAEGSWLIITLHNIITGTPSATTEWKESYLREVADYIHMLQAEGKDLEVKTVADALGVDSP
jgi:peptidoglycan/xylan/chitin deacetylase (PgdA/CDA1 family)